MTLHQVITFAPLSRGRYRCNQTDGLVKKRQLNSYRNAHLISSIRQPPQAKEMTVKLGKNQVEFTCPNCPKRHAFSGMIIVRACSCGVQLTIQRRGRRELGI